MASQIRNRIVDHIEVKGKDLQDNQGNWRIHPQMQRDALNGVLAEVGIVDELIVYESERQGGLTILDGHLRAGEHPDVEWPCTVLDLTDEEADLVLATFDPLAGMAEMGARAMEMLLDKVRPDVAEPAVLDMLDGLAEQAEMALAELEVVEDNLENISGSLPGAAALKPSMKFDSDLPWDIPMLLPEMLCDIPEPLDTWAGPDVCQDDQISWWLYNWGSDSIRGLPLDRTLLAFYVDDKRFENFWFVPDSYVGKVLNSGISKAISPNYSLWAEAARATHLYNTFRSRWVGRYMQEAGIKIIPDINWFDERSFEFCLIGIPCESPAISVQLQTVREKLEIKRAVKGLKMSLEMLKPQSLLIYGGPTAQDILEKVQPECRVVFTLNRVGKRRSVVEKQDEEVIR